MRLHCVAGTTAVRARLHWHCSKPSLDSVVGSDLGVLPLYRYVIPLMSMMTLSMTLSSALRACNRSCSRTSSDDACRYHLYVGNACPWCHRVLLALALLGLDRYITFTWLLDDAERASRGGWVFDAATGVDPVFSAKDLRYMHYSRLRARFARRALLSVRTEVERVAWFMRVQGSTAPAPSFRSTVRRFVQRGVRARFARLQRPLHGAAAC